MKFLNLFRKPQPGAVRPVVPEAVRADVLKIVEENSRWFRHCDENEKGWARFAFGQIVDDVMSEAG